MWHSTDQGRLTPARMLRAAGPVVAAGFLAFGVAACGSSSSASSGTSASDSGSSAPTGVAAAAIAPYLTHPGPFPVTESLRKVPRGATIDYMNAGTPVAALLYELLQPAAKVMGVHLVSVPTGSSATTISTGFDTAISSKPAAVLVSGLPVPLWADKLKELQAAKIVVVTGGIDGTAQYGLKYSLASDAQNDEAATLMADYVAAKFGSNAKVAYYTVPEIAFTTAMAPVFQAELKRVCAACSVRVVPIPIAALASTAPSMVVSDLQSHADTSVAVFSTDEIEIGLPAKLREASIQVKTFGYTPTPANLSQIKNGQEDAAFSGDVPVFAWEMLDLAAREITGQPVTGDEAKGLTDFQFLTASDITNPSQGWTGYPDFAKRFAVLWNPA